MGFSTCERFAEVWVNSESVKAGLDEVCRIENQAETT